VLGVCYGDRGHVPGAVYVTRKGRSEVWQDRVPEELIEQLQDSDEYLEFTDEWRELSADEQLGLARDWLRKAMGLEAWR
jgi:hypothetical protein